MSCGQQALERAGIKVDKYFASEIDKYAIQVTMANYPDTIQLGSVVGVDGYALPKIDLLIGGSPCQSFSFAGKRKGMATTDEQEILTLEHYLQLKADGFEFEGQSYLFWEFMRLLYEVKPKYFLLENVEMGEKWERVLTQAIGVNALHINSALVSAQNRKRIYFTNIGMEAAGLFGYPVSIIQKPKDRKILLKDILESEVDEKYFLSEKLIAGFERHKALATTDNMLIVYNNRRLNETLEKHKDELENGTLICSYNKEIHKDKSITISTRVNASSCTHIVHNTMPRSSTTGKGGTDHLSRNDGKTYCLDTGNTNAVEVREVKQLSTNNKSNGGTQPYQQDRIYDVNGISPALQAQLPNGSTMINTSRIRRLTPLECMRLQTVDDNYKMPVSDSQKYKMLGNGWTIEVISHIFKYISLL
jgi:DNA (cytosine-5)-methyltransferase 3A